MARQTKQQSRINYEISGITARHLQRTAKALQRSSFYTCMAKDYEGDSRANTVARFYHFRLPLVTRGVTPLHPADDAALRAFSHSN